MSRILLLLENVSNRRLLASALESHYQVVSAAPQPAALDEAFDLCILDGPALEKTWQAVEARKAKESPAFLPFLLVTARQDAGMATRHLWKTIDEVLLSPVEMVELQARVASLLLARRMSAEFHRVMLEELPAAVILLNPDGTVHYWNEAAEALLGWRADDLLDKPLPNVWQGTGDSWEAMLQRALKGETQKNQEVTLRTREGRTLVVEVSLSPLSLPGEAAQGVRAIFLLNDVTARKQAEEARRQRLAELEALDRVTSALRQARTISEALPILLDETLAVLDFPAGAIWLYHSAEDELRTEIARGWLAEIREVPLKPGEGIAGHVFASKQALISAEFASDGRAHPAVAEQIPPGWGGACIPIHALENIVGVFCVSCALPRQIQPEQVKLLEALARMAGVTLQRMELHEETLRRMEQLSTLSAIDRTILSSTDLRLALGIISKQIAADLRADAVAIRLLDRFVPTLSFAAGSGFRDEKAARRPLRLGEGLGGRAVYEQRIVQSVELSAETWQDLLAANEGFSGGIAAPLIAKGEVKGTLEVYYRASFQPDSDWLDFFRTLQNQVALAVDNAQMFENLLQSNLDLAAAYDATIEGWSRALDLRDKETEGHTLRVTEMTLRLARAAGMKEDQLAHVRRGALLHDIGKMGIPDAILLKPGKLTDEEWAIMRKHPTLAYEMLSPIAYLRPALDIPYCHHEKWDGSGYPRGLKGEQISLAARLFAVVDVWDALTSARPYRQAWSQEKTIEYIQQQAGFHFDPQVIDLFLQMMSEEEH